MVNIVYRDLIAYDNTITKKGQVMSKWELEWNDSPGFKDRIIFRMVGDKGGILEEFSLEPPDHAKLYYALMDWFQDRDREVIKP